MSHTTTISTVKIQDRKALTRAVEELNAAGVSCRLEENARPRMYYREQEELCELVLRLDNAKCRHTSNVYDIGFKKLDDGSLGMIFDEYGNGVASQLGVRVSEGKTSDEKSQRCVAKLTQLYSKHAVINKARAQGYTVTSAKLDAKGAVQLRIAV